MKAVVLACALLLTGCASGPAGVGQPLAGSSLDQFTRLLNTQPESVGSTMLVGQQLILAYNEQGAQFRKRRNLINLGVLVASTYVTAASALDAHADSIFAGALTGQTLLRLDPIVNPGGVESWSSAISKITCTISAASGSQSPEALSAYFNLKSSVDPTQQAAVQRYENLKTVVMTKYTAIHGGYLQATTAALISDEQFAKIIKTAGQKTAQEENAEPTEATGGAAPTAEDVATLNAVVTTIEANLKACG